MNIQMFLNWYVPSCNTYELNKMQFKLNIFTLLYVVIYPLTPRRTQVSPFTEISILF